MKSMGDKLSDAGRAACVREEDAVMDWRRDREAGMEKHIKELEAEVSDLKKANAIWQGQVAFFRDANLWLYYLDLACQELEESRAEVERLRKGNDELVKENHDFRLNGFYSMGLKTSDEKWRQKIQAVRTSNQKLMNEFPPNSWVREKCAIKEEVYKALLSQEKEKEEKKE